MDKALIYILQTLAAAKAAGRYINRATFAPEKEDE